MWITARVNHASRCTTVRVSAQDRTESLPPIPEHGPHSLSKSDVDPALLTRVDADTAILLNNKQEWLEELSWTECTEYFRQTITVPPACKDSYAHAFSMCLQLWDWNFHSLSIKLHYVITICCCAPLDRRDGAGTATEQFKQRMARLMEGDWDALWAEAHAVPSRPQQQVHTPAQNAYKKAARAEHFALHGHYSEARNILMGSG